MSKTSSAGTAPKTAFWNDARTRGILYQILVLGGVLLLAGYLVSNTMDRLAQQSIASGFGFLDKEASFGISESLIDYSPADDYGRAFLVGLLNTFQVGVLGIILATVLGTVIGIARLSNNWLIAKLASVYIEVIRNIPLLLQLFFWFALVTELLPHPRQALNPAGDIFLSNRGLMFPVPEAHPVYFWMGVALLIAIGACIWLFRYARRLQDRTGRQMPVFRYALLLVIGLPLVVFVLAGAPLSWDVPALRGFNFRGGMTFSPEFAALLAGLTFYTAAFIAEIVRSGIIAVPKGQTEASLALGLSRGKVLRLVILPQALRVIVPPLTSQYLNLIKNSSLAVAIGYPDLVSIANTTINQTGQAIEGIAMIMATYLTISLAISAFMNWYNKRIAFKER